MSRYGTAATPDRPEFEVRVAGTPVTPLVHGDVVEIDVAEEVGRHGRLALLLQNWDPDTRAVRHSDDGPFAPGADVEVLLGYHAQLTSVFAGVVAAVTTHFPASGQPVLRVEARSRSILLEHPPRSRQLEAVSDADVVSAVAADYSLTADAGAGVTRAAVVSDRRSDWDLLTTRAAELGWVTYVRGTTLVFRPPADPVGPIELEYGRNVTELHLTQDLTRAVDSVVGAGWDADVLEALESQVGAIQTGLDLGDRVDHGAAVSDAGWPLREERVARASLPATDQVDAIALGRQRATALLHYHGYGEVVGNPALRCDGWLRITGVGERMSGPHYTTAARHRLSARGYRTEFQVGSPPALRPPLPGRPAPLTIGVVASLEDPDGLNRVRVRLPWRGETGDGVWARLATLDAGDGFGTVFVPGVGQEVLVAPLDGEDAALVVLGSLFNGTQAAPVAMSNDDNLVRAVVSPEGHRITLEDGDASAVTIETPAGNVLRLAEADSEVTLTHGESGNAIRLSADGIELTAARGDIVLKASSGTVELDAGGIRGRSSGPATLESSGTLDVKASATLGLKGALVTIN
ncbi:MULTISPECIES: phage baseplate assembly protein V [unclassified Geodermatophilus]|uniref:phage baseplate assembly protein V n=1 Tax=unclassified Geodermatophilus TaxID=2637632 RepID=UPI003EEEE2F2